MTFQPLRPGNQERLVPEGIGVEAGEFPVVDGAAHLDLHGETVLGLAPPAECQQSPPEQGPDWGDLAWLRPGSPSGPSPNSDEPEEPR